MRDSELTPSRRPRKYRSIKERRALAAQDERKERSRNRRKKVAHRLSALAISVGSIGGIGQYVADDPWLIPRNVADLATEHGADPVQDSTMKTIDAEAKSSTDARVEKILRQMRTLHSPVGHDFDEDGKLTPLDMALYEHEEEDWSDDLAHASIALSREIAVENGLHLINVSPYLERIDQATTVQQVLDVLQDYTAQLGPHLMFSEDHDLRDFLFKSVYPAFDSDDIKLSDNLKANVKKSLYSLSLVPHEVYEYADITEIRVVGDLGFTEGQSTGSGQVGGTTHPETGYVYFNAEDLFSGDLTILFHEMGHRIDYKLNHESIIGAKRDREYNALNHGHQYSDDTSSAPTGVARHYGEKDILEDKATMMEGMLDGIDTSLLYSDDATVQAKYHLLLGRLEEAIPGYSKYLLSSCEHNKQAYSNLTYIDFKTSS